MPAHPRLRSKVVGAAAEEEVDAAADVRGEKGPPGGLAGFLRRVAASGTSLRIWKAARPPRSTVWPSVCVQ